MNKILFDAFNSVSAKAWKQKIQVDLKGLEYNDTLISTTNEDIHIKPFYHADGLNNDFASRVTQDIDWYICQSIFVADEEKSNANAIDILNRGAEQIKFIIPTNSVSVKKVLQNIDLTSTQIYFELHFLDPEFVKQLVEIVPKASLFINTDIIGNLTQTGNWFSNLNEDHSNFKSIVEQTKTFSIDIDLYQNAGANSVQQLAYGLSQANEYLNFLDENNSYTAIFNVAIGSNYFFEIAKLRALRLLWKTIASEYGITTDCIIYATPTKRNKTLYDYNTNMLRTTTECMSAALGGSNTICNLAYDAIYHKNNEFGDRISRNQLLILKHESYFDKVNNPADGVYYLENLTEQIAEKALVLFKDIESNGGFLNQLKEGTIQRKIKESAAKEQEQFNTEEIILLGTNKYPNSSDTMKHELELYPFIKMKSRKTLIEPIVAKRLSETIEQNRLNKEKS